MQVPLSRIVLILARPWALCAVAFGVLTALRPHLALYLADPFPRGMALGTVFAAVYCAMLWTFSQRRESTAAW